MQRRLPDETRMRPELPPPPCDEDEFEEWLTLLCRERFPEA